MVWEIVSHKAFFPGVLMALDCCAAARYGWDGEWWRAGYWVAAAAITLCATCAR